MLVLGLVVVEERIVVGLEVVDQEAVLVLRSGKMVRKKGQGLVGE